MSERPGPARIACDAVVNCPHSWVEFIARKNGRIVEVKRSCRIHVRPIIDYMNGLDAKVEVRIAR